MITINSEKRQQMIDITEQVNSLVRKSGAKEGICHVFCKHTTGAVTINENWDPSVVSDAFKVFNELVPKEFNYQHSEGNSQAHILSILIGSSETIPVRNGKLALGQWQGLMFVELDGPRNGREVQVTIK